MQIAWEADSIPPAEGSRNVTIHIGFTSKPEYSRELEWAQSSEAAYSARSLPFGKWAVRIGEVLKMWRRIGVIRLLDGKGARMEKRTAIIVFAEGFEEVEALTPADVLRRAGVEVALVGLEGVAVVGAHGLVLQMDRALREREEVDAVILPGGLPGAENLSRSKTLLNILRGQLDSGKTVAAICASPGLVLGRNGLLKGKRATCYPGFEKHFGADATFVEEAVVKDGNLITSRGPGTAFDFALALAKELAGERKAEEVGKGMLYIK